MRAAELRRVAAEAAAMLRTMRTATPAPVRVTAVWCLYCRRWLKPSKFPTGSAACASCAPVLAARHRRALREAGR